ncbi:YpoC family protein [Neobacillus sp. PS3-40]|uniref:YpoC family protein n=1 Tax=Neobacillus sp. PS3-40 TaxID=3070679 RepID=UPI0027E0485C|nr:hypothetical protein [Neobacillus sp. PS3-40]WML45078.1 hypothetical protein RCG20_04030 [Neobacillus sp. PS3-40]
MDDSIKRLQIPDELVHPFFFSENEIAVKKPPVPFTLEVNFICELFYYNGIETFKPWVSYEEVIPTLLDKWQTEKDHLKLLHRERDQKNILQSMKKGIGLFIQLLFWSNGEPVQLNESFSILELAYKPVNVQERLRFIISRPNLFHSYIQLSELMLEQEKQYEKKNIMKKAFRPKV